MWISGKTSQSGTDLSHHEDHEGDKTFLQRYFFVTFVVNIGRLKLSR
ncbi:hypothetical protein D3OALGB2SA_699 [Olavius algarvensis associated proteobacterium Delta 3]|nr:hypothetical protein D3OALGB2SA_699 [Olavius algarvensis associated proteobacterium Delta 3]